MSITRRKLLHAFGSLGIGAALTGAASKPEQQTTSQLDRKLGNTDLSISPVGFGAEHTRDPDLIRYALDQGINHIETAWAYGFGKSGNSCECIGKAIKGKRDSVHLLVAYHGDAPRTSGAWVANQFEQTLRDLRTDYIDVFLWHQPKGVEMITEGENVEVMEKWKTQGKIRWCGITAHQDQELYLDHLATSSIYNVAVVAFNYKSPPELAKAIEIAAQKGVGIIAMKTQSPDYMRPDKPTIGDAPDHKRALTWVLSQSSVTAAIPGMTTREQVDLNMQVMNAVSSKPASRSSQL